MYIVVICFANFFPITRVDFIRNICDILIYMNDICMTFVERENGNLIREKLVTLCVLFHSSICCRELNVRCMIQITKICQLKNYARKLQGTDVFTDTIPAVAAFSKQTRSPALQTRPKIKQVSSLRAMTSNWQALMEQSFYSLLSDIYFRLPLSSSVLFTPFSEFRISSDYHFVDQVVQNQFQTTVQFCEQLFKQVTYVATCIIKGVDFS